MEKWIAEKIGVQKLTQENLRNYQLQKINETVNYAAANSAFYKKLFADSKLPVNDWQTFTDLPFTTAADIQKQGTKLVCVPQEEIFRIVTLHTSGTTDKPKRIYFTADDQELTVDFFDNGMQTLTEKGDNVLILLPAKTPGCVGDLLAKGLERFGAVPHRFGVPQNFAETLQYMADNNINAVVANPEHMLALACLAKQKQMRINLKSILLSTDFLAESLLQRLTKTFNTKVFEHYGLTETGLGGGVSCLALQGYHLREADLYFEIIDPQTGENLPDGTWGEIVFTTLTRKAMPLIRYRTGDYGRFLTEPCPCGSVLRRLDKVLHRLETKGVSLFKITDFDEAVFSIDNIFNYDLTVNSAEKKLILTVYCLTEPKKAKSETAERIANLTHGYNTEINVAVGFAPKHYMLQKRQINSL